jgi:hypothetical protein
MQADGLNLEAIRRVLDGGEGAPTEIFDFTRALRAPFEEAPEVVEAAELAGVWAAEGDPDPQLMARAESSVSCALFPTARVEVISPRLQRAAIALTGEFHRSRLGHF